MDVIRKRLQAYKLELENATERAEQAEKQLKEHKARGDRAEGEAAALTRRIQLLEENLEKSEDHLRITCKKLEDATQSADEGERVRKMLEHRQSTNEERIEALECSLKEAKLLNESSDQKYDDCARKLALIESELGRTEDRASKAEEKESELEEELRSVGDKLRSLELNTERELQQQQTFELAMATAHQRLQEAETRAEVAERTVKKLQKEIDRLEGALVSEREKYKNISEELDQTFSELTAC